MGKFALKVNVSDPMSGYFMLRRETFENQMHRMSGRGFKVLLDILASTKGEIRIEELPYVMRQRRSGESKLDMMVVSEYYMLLLDKLVGKYIPVRFLMFVTVGMVGVFVHLFVLMIMHRQLDIDFIVSQSAATVVAMTTNYIINNRFTYRDMRLKGLGFVYGLFSFYLACSVGALISIELSDFLFSNGVNWLIAGVTGAFIGSVWNYAMTATFTWKKQRQE